jgi:hypothetical protein
VCIGVVLKQAMITKKRKSSHNNVGKEALGDPLVICNSTRNGGIERLYYYYSDSLPVYGLEGIKGITISNDE